MVAQMANTCPTDSISMGKCFLMFFPMSSTILLAMAAATTMALVENKVCTQQLAFRASSKDKIKDSPVVNDWRRLVKQKSAA